MPKHNTSATYLQDDIVTITSQGETGFLRIVYVDNFGVCGSYTTEPIMPDDVDGIYLGGDSDTLFPWHTIDRIESHITNALYERAFDEWEERTTPPKPDPLGNWAALAAKARQR